MEPPFQQELIALELLANSDIPVGAAKLEAEWRAAGIIRGEATAGRFLRRCDDLGFTELLNQKRGRVLSLEGANRLEELRRLAKTNEAEQSLQKALSDSMKDDLIDLLMVRRLVECETTRLAAYRATEAERQEILEVAASCCWSDDETSARASVSFHLTVAAASHSPLLYAVMNLLLDPSRDHLEVDLSGITRVSGISERLQVEHREIANLIAAGDGEAASAAMANHFDRLIAEGQQ